MHEATRRRHHTHGQNLCWQRRQVEDILVLLLRGEVAGQVQDKLLLL